MGTLLPHHFGAMDTRGSCARSWVFTINHPERWHLWTELPKGVKYICWQAERGEKLGTLHLQGYVELHRKQRVSYLLKNLCDKGHYEVRRGSREQARTYCMKDKGRQGGPWEYGTWAGVTQGRRVDIEAFRDAIMDGLRAPRLWLEYTHEMAKFPRMYLSLKSCIRPRRTEPLKVTLIHGKTGIGKTRLVYACWEDDDEFWRWPCPNTAVWFDGYDAHKLCLLDDFAGKASKMSLTMLLQVLDRYPLRLPIKGSFVWWMPTRIMITTNIHPKDWYDWTGREGQYRALKRRIHEVLDLTIKSETDDPVQAGPGFWWDPLLDPRPPEIDLRADERFSFESDDDVRDDPFDQEYRGQPMDDLNRQDIAMDEPPIFPHPGDWHSQESLDEWLDQMGLHKADSQEDLV